MKNKDLRKKRERQKKLKDSTFFDEETLPKVRKSIDEIVEELDKELAKNNKIIAEIDRVMLETMSYEQLVRLSRSVRLSLE